MVTVQVHLFGRLKLEVLVHGQRAAGDGTLPLTLPEGSTVREAIDKARVPAARIAMALVNGRDCAANTPLAAGDRVVLVPQEFAALWPARHL